MDGKLDLYLQNCSIFSGPTSSNSLYKVEIRLKVAQYDILVSQHLTITGQRNFLSMKNGHKNSISLKVGIEIKTRFDCIFN